MSQASGINISRRGILTTGASAAALSFADRVFAADVSAGPGDAEILETLKLAYRWGYPLLAMAINNTDFYGPTLNAFYNMKSAADEKSQAGKGFNAETLYSAGALDLTQEPLVFSMPDVGDRFVVFPVQDGWGNIDNVIGTRTVGNRGGNFLISGPDWTGDVPEGMKHFKLASNVGFLPGRSMVTSPEDAKMFTSTVQDKFALTPLSRGERLLPIPTATRFPARCQSTQRRITTHSFLRCQSVNTSTGSTPCWPTIRHMITTRRSWRSLRHWGSDRG